MTVDEPERSVYVDMIVLMLPGRVIVMVTVAVKVLGDKFEVVVITVS